MKSRLGIQSLQSRAISVELVTIASAILTSLKRVNPALNRAITLTRENRPAQSARKSDPLLLAATIAAQKGICAVKRPATCLVMLRAGAWMAPGPRAPNLSGSPNQNGKRGKQSGMRNFTRTLRTETESPPTNDGLRAIAAMPQASSLISASCPIPCIHK